MRTVQARCVFEGWEGATMSEQTEAFRKMEERFDPLYGFFRKKGVLWVYEGYKFRKATKREADLRFALYKERAAHERL